MAVNIVGVVAIVVFYLLILFVGIFTAWKKRKNEATREEAMLANRNIGWAIGTFTMTATWVGGGFINGTAEAVYSSGLLWAQAPWGYALSLVVGGFAFAKVMRRRGYITMVDPFQEKYGARLGGLIYLPALLGEIFWSGAILGALGSSLTVILDLPSIYTVTISACIAILYTFIGGLYSVAYTDVIQLICIFVGLWVCVPFALTSPHVTSISVTKDVWLGKWDPVYTGVWIDNALLLIFGGIPWQVYFQRVLSSQSSKKAQILSFNASIGCIILSIPSVLIGAIGASTNWEATDYGTTPTGDDTQLILPLVLQYLTPMAVQFIGLGTVSAAVMSSADSSVLSASSMFAHNIYKCVLRPSASEKEVMILMKVAIVVVGVLAATVALTVSSIYGLWFISSDLVYCILFPQLVCVIYLPFVNSSGYISGYVVGLVLRIVAGDPVLKIPPLLKYPYYNDADGQLFPFRTFTCLMSALTIVIVSYVVRQCNDKYGCCPDKPMKESDPNKKYAPENRTEKAQENMGYDNQEDQNSYYYTTAL